MMERLTSDAEAYRACLASMLQMDLEEFPTFEGLAAPLQWNAWLAAELNVIAMQFAFGTIPTPPGLWLARMASPYQGYDGGRVPERDDDGAAAAVGPGRADGPVRAAIARGP
jgi:hypothetical protein